VSRVVKKLNFNLNLELDKFHWHPCAPLTSLPTFLLTTSPSPAPLTSVRWPDSNVQAAAGRVP